MKGATGYVKVTSGPTTQDPDHATPCRQSLAYVPVDQMDAGSVYLSWLKSCGGTIGEWALHYAEFLRREPLSGSLYRDHQRRVGDLNRLEQNRTTFTHLTKLESEDRIGRALEKPLPTGKELLTNKSKKVESNDVNAAISKISEPVVIGETDKDAQDQLDDDEWLLVVPLEFPEANEEALEEAEMFAGKLYFLSISDPIRSISRALIYDLQAQKSIPHARRDADPETV